MHWYYQLHRSSQPLSRLYQRFHPGERYMRRQYWELRNQRLQRIVSNLQGRVSAGGLHLSAYSLESLAVYYLRRVWKLSNMQVRIQSLQSQVHLGLSFRG